ncbi:MAG: hypothetical protein QOE35_438 [Actinomycetota bacterium]
MRSGGGTVTGTGSDQDERPDDRRAVDRAVAIEADLAELARDELQRRTDAPLPRSLVDFLR